MGGSLRRLVDAVLGSGRIRRPAFLGVYKLRRAPAYREYLKGRSALEIGGPSDLFALGPLPIYSALRSIDDCNYASSTLWQQNGSLVSYRRRFVAEATRLEPVEDGAYDCVLASHVLEHLANPLRALFEWRRVLKDDGLLLLVAPDKHRTFDWKRPTTPIEHLLADYENDTPEDDLTHLDEILELHDLSRDPGKQDATSFRARSLDNAANRALHHHVFDHDSLEALLAHAALTPVLTDTARPFHLIVLARKQPESG